MSKFSEFKSFYFDKEFYKRAALIALPMIVQQSITNFVSLLDNVMVGQLGTEAMSGVAITNQLAFVYWVTIFGITSAAGIFGAQFYGNGDARGHMHSFRGRLMLCLITAVFSMILFKSMDERLLSIYIHDAGERSELTLKMGKDYLGIIIFTFIPYALSNAYASTIRETGQTVVPMVSTLVAVVTNICLDLVLIFGLGPIPALGVKGAALATLIARSIELMINVVWTHSHPKSCPFVIGVYKSAYIPLKFLKDLFIKGSPLIVNEILWSLGMATMMALYSIRGLNAVAAGNIAATINDVINTISMQSGGALAIIVGQKLGAGKIDEAVEADKKMIFFCVVLCTSVGIIYGILGRGFPQFYNTDPEVKRLAASFITVFGLSGILMALENSYYFTLRCGGKTLITFVFDCLYTWIFLIPLIAFLAKVTTVSALFIYTASYLGLIPKVAVGYVMTKKGLWINKLV